MIDHKTCAESLPQLIEMPYDYASWPMLIAKSVLDISAHSDTVIVHKTAGASIWFK